MDDCVYAQPYDVPVGTAELESCLEFSLLDIILCAAFSVTKHLAVLKKMSLVVGSVSYVISSQQLCLCRVGGGTTGLCSRFALCEVAS